jgi:hypothetical protein
MTFPRLTDWLLAVATALLVLGTGANCWGEVTPLADYHKAVVRVGQSIGNGESASGTGTLICREHGGLVISVAHVFEGNGPCWVDYGGGRRVQAQLLGVDRTLDLAALRTQEPPADIPCIELAQGDEYAPQGSVVEFIGFGGGHFRHFTANTLGYQMRGGEPSQLTMDFQSISGDSGGPVLYQGKVVAVQWGYAVEASGGKSQGTSCGHIQRFLTQYQIPQCRGGNCRPQYQPQVRPIQPAPGAPLVNVPPKPCNCGNLKSCTCDSAALIVRIEKLEKLLVELQARPGLPGPAGPQGPAGAKGDTGPAGAAAQVNVDDIAAKLPPITVQLYDEGKLIPNGTRKIHLGGVLPLGRYSVGSK